MSNQIDFLTLISDKRLRKEIRNICGSYSHPWDVLAELCQNAVDAINLFKKTYPQSNRAHRIEIEVDSIRRRIGVRDTGVGLELGKLSTCLAPHGTFKDDDEGAIGEKGVGLTFAAFSCNSVEVKSRTAQGSYEVSIEAANAWKNGHVRASFQRLM